MTGLKRFSRGLDWSGADLGATDLTDAGAYSFVGRYTAGEGLNDPHAQWKLATEPEVSSLTAAGFDVFLFSEWYAGRVTEGYHSGLIDGEHDYQRALDLGLPKGVGLVPSWDEGQPSYALHPRLADYLRGYRHSCGYRAKTNTAAGHVVVGLYAGDVAIRAMINAKLADFAVRAEAESWSVDEPAGAGWFHPGSNWLAAAKAVAAVSPANAWQNGNTAFNAGADEEVILSTWEYGSLSARGKRPNPKPPVVPPPDPRPRPTLTTYTVRPGDTLSGLAARRGASVRQLIQLNRASYASLSSNPDLLRVGWVLRVPRFEHKVAPAKTYVVRHDDTLWDIARRQHTTVTQLIAWNSHTHPALARHPNRLTEGLRLRVRD